MENVVQWILQHLKELVVPLFLALWALGPILQARSRKKRAESSRPGTGPATGPSDLERKVRRTFEELLRRTGQQGSSTAPPRPAAPPVPGPRAATRRVERVPVPAPDAADLDELDEPPAAPHHPPPKPSPHVTHHPPHSPASSPATAAESWAAPAVPQAPKSAPDHRARRTRVPTSIIRAGGSTRDRAAAARSLLLRGGELDRAELRRAFLLKVILDAPPAVTGFQGPLGTVPPAGLRRP